MRVLITLLPLLVLSGACQHSVSSPPERRPPRPVMSLSEAASAMAEGSVSGEARLAAAGPDAVPHLTPMLKSPDRDVRRKALRLLVDSGEDIELSVEDRVDLLLFEIVREDSQPYSALRALSEMEELGPDAVPALRVAARRDDAEADAARRLLQMKAR